MSNPSVVPFTSTVQRPWPEDLSRADILLRQDSRFRELLSITWQANEFYRQKWLQAGLTAADVTGLADLSLLPFTTKAECAADQAAVPPYGSNRTSPLPAYVRVHQTSGTTTGKPLRWLDTARNWQWILECWSQSYRLLELAPDERLCFPFSFGPFLGFWAGFEGAVAQGRMCLAAGGLSSEARLRLIDDHQITLLGCTPSYALRLAEVADELGINLRDGSVRKILVAGEPGGGIPETRARIEQAWGARVFDHWGMTELGPLATEAAHTPGSLTVLETECIAEVLDPETLTPVPEGQTGELVITNLGRIDSPLIRYRTGDLVVADRSPDPRGRSLLRLRGGVLGRTDDMLIIRGNNIFPSTIESIVRRFAEVAEFRIVVQQVRAMPHLRIDLEPVASPPADWLTRVEQALAAQFPFQIEIRSLPPGTLPRFEMKARRLVRE